LALEVTLVVEMGRDDEQQDNSSQDRHAQPYESRTEVHLKESTKQENIEHWLSMSKIGINIKVTYDRKDGSKWVIIWRRVAAKQSAIFNGN
jgi:hypothetical protein